MAQKSQKAQAARNVATLRRTHLIAVGVHGFYWLFRALIFRSSFGRKSLLVYIVLSIPAVAIEFFFERSSRPVYSEDGTQLKKSGEDLEAKGLTEYMWDVLYWTWGCTAGAALLGDWVWYLYIAVPVYSAYAAYTAFTNVRSGLGLGGPAVAQEAESGAKANGASKRQQKLEKRGGQKMQYR